MIVLQNVSKSFGEVTAVDDLSFSVGAGEVLGFLGPNGAGKSTTMKMITGFIEPTSGTIEVCSHPVRSQSLAARRMIGYLPEGAPAYGDMTVRQFLGFIASVRDLHGDERRRHIDTVVEQLELASVMAQRIETLSKGFKRRVGLAQALLHDPAVLILDEPTDGLDPNQKHHVRELIRGLARDKIVVISTHILEEVTAVCTRAMIIAGGRLVADATPEAMLARSRYHGAVTVSFEQPPADFIARLEALPGVASVEPDDSSEGRFTLFPADGAAPLAAVRELIDEQGWEVAELFVEKGRLDEVFRTVTAESQYGGTAHA